MQTTYHVRIKKDYAAAIIEDLEKIDAVELIPENEAYSPSESQKDEVRRRIAKYKDHPDQLLDEDTFFRMLNEE